MTISPELLRDAREIASLTQAELAQALGVSQRTIVNWEAASGSGVPRKAERKVRALLGDALALAPSLPGPWDVTHLTPPPEDDTWDDPDQGLGIGDELEAMRRRRREALDRFSDIDLMDELRDRAWTRGVRPTDFSTRAVDKRDSRRLRGLNVRGEDQTEAPRAAMTTPRDTGEDTDTP